MKLERIFVDANVIVDLFENRVYSEYSASVIEKLITMRAELFTSCDLITTVYYVLSKQNRERALDSVEDATTIFKLIPFSNEEVFEAVSLMKNNSNFKDFEDTVQYVLAKKENCDLILTNDENFFSPDIKTITAKDLYEKVVNE